MRRQGFGTLGWQETGYRARMSQSAKAPESGELARWPRWHRANPGKSSVCRPKSSVPPRPKNWHAGGLPPPHSPITGAHQAVACSFSLYRQVSYLFLAACRLRSHRVSLNRQGRGGSAAARGRGARAVAPGSSSRSPAPDRRGPALHGGVDRPPPQGQPPPRTSVPVPAAKSPSSRAPPPPRTADPPAASW